MENKENKENEEIKRHPTYLNYGAVANGKIYNYKLKKEIKVKIDKYGYARTGIRYNNQTKQIRVGRFVYECFFGLIPDDKEVDHKNDIRNDNKITNLQLLSHSDNIKKKYTTGYKNNFHKMGYGKRVEATNLNDNIITTYNSIYGAGVALNIVPASVNRVCRGMQKTALSKDSNIKYSFKFI